MSQAMVVSLDIGDIVEGDRLRQPAAADIQKISLSMSEHGLITPIKVRPHPTEKSRYLLVAGSTRLAAAKLLGWPKIEAIIKNMSEEEAALEEVDENLYRSDLTPSDQTFFMKRRLELFEFQGGKLKRGRPLRKSANLADLDLNPREQDLLYRQIDEKFGIKRRTAERLVRRARNIPEGLWPVIKSAKKAVNGSLLDKIAELEPQKRAEVERLVVEERQKLSDALKQVREPKPEKALTVEQAVKTIAPAWSAWSPKQRAEFIRMLKEEQ